MKPWRAYRDWSPSNTQPSTTFSIWTKWLRRQRDWTEVMLVARKIPSAFCLVSVSVCKSLDHPRRTLYLHHSRGGFWKCASLPPQRILSRTGRPTGWSCVCGPWLQSNSSSSHFWRIWRLAACWRGAQKPTLARRQPKRWKPNKYFYCTLFFFFLKLISCWYFLYILQINAKHDSSLQLWSHVDTQAETLMLPQYQSLFIVSKLKQSTMNSTK